MYGKKPQGLTRAQRLRRHSGGPAQAVQGRLVHSTAPASPVPGLWVEVILFDGRREQHLGRIQSGEDGRFHLPTRLPMTARNKVLKLKVVALRGPLEAGEPLERRWRVVARAQSAPLQVLDHVEFGDVLVPFWEYRRGWCPRLAINPEQPEQLPPQVEAQHYAQRWKAAQMPELSVGSSGPQASDSMPSLAEQVFHSPQLVWVERQGHHICRVQIPQLGLPGESELPEIEFRAVGHQGRLRLEEVRLWHAGQMQCAVSPGGESEALDVAGAVLRLHGLVYGIWGGLLLPLEGVAIATFRHLTASPYGAYLRPHLRDLSLVNLAIEQMLTVQEMWDWLPMSVGILTEHLKRAVFGAYDPRQQPWMSAPDEGLGGPLSTLREGLRHAITAAERQEEAQVRKTWGEVRRFCAEVHDNAPAAPVGLVGREERVVPRIRGRRPTESESEAFVAYASAVGVRVLGEGAVYRRHLLSWLAKPAGGVSVAQQDGTWTLQESPEGCRQRMALFSTLTPPEGRALSDDPLGDVPSGTRRAVAGMKETYAALGLSWDAVGARVLT